MLLSYSTAGVRNMELIAVIALLVLAVDVTGNPQLGSLHRQDYNDSISVPEDGENLIDAGARYALSLLSAEERQSIIDECIHALVSKLELSQVYFIAFLIYNDTYICKNAPQITMYIKVYKINRSFYNYKNTEYVVTSVLEMSYKHREIQFVKTFAIFNYFVLDSNRCNNREISTA